MADIPADSDDLPDKAQLAASERAALETRWPVEFRDGASCGFLSKEAYPKGFHAWPIDRRNAWFAGFNKGNFERSDYQKDIELEIEDE